MDSASRMSVPVTLARVVSGLVLPQETRTPDVPGADAMPRGTVLVRGCLARHVSVDQFLDLAQHEPDISMAVMRQLSRRLQSANVRLAESRHISASTRVARVLYAIASRYGVATPDGISIGLNLTQPEVADLANLSQPSLHRVLTDLRRRGIISLGYREIRIVEIDELEKLTKIDQ